MRCFLQSFEKYEQLHPLLASSYEPGAKPLSFEQLRQAHNCLDLVLSTFNACA